MWPFTRSKNLVTIQAHTVETTNGIVIVDVRGQTCPGYLLAIDKAVDRLAKGTTARLLISYPPCGDDVRAWCSAREIEYVKIERQNGVWEITIKI